MLTAERLRELLHYDRATGVFTWRVTRSRSAKIGGEAGTMAEGRIQIQLDRRVYRAHRLAWLYVYGVWPAGDLDHRDMDATHNWIDNLRPTTPVENQQNICKPRRHNLSGLLGVQSNGGRRWLACLVHRGVRYRGQSRDTPQEAHADYLKLKAQYHPFATITKDHACSN